MFNCMFTKIKLAALGIDTSSGQPPSSFQMMKLATSSEFRDAAKRVVDEMQKAGVDLRSKVGNNSTPLHINKLKIVYRRSWMKS